MRVSGGRRIAFTILTAILSLTSLYGMLLLVGGWFVTGSLQIHRIHALGAGALFGLLLGAGCAAQLRHPQRRIAGLQQAALVALAVALAGALSGKAVEGLIFFAALGGTVGLVAMLHPARGEFFKMGSGASRPMVLVAALGAIPAVKFACAMTRLQRTGSPLDSHVGEYHYFAMAAMALGIVLVALLAALRTPGWRISAWCAGLAAVVYGVGSTLFTGYASSEGTVWGVLAIAGGALFIGIAEAEHRATAGDEGNASTSQTSRESSAEQEGSNPDAGRFEYHDASS